MGWALLEGVVLQLRGAAAGRRDAPASLPPPGAVRKEVGTARTNGCLCAEHRHSGGCPEVVPRRHEGTSGLLMQQ